MSTSAFSKVMCYNHSTNKAVSKHSHAEIEAVWFALNHTVLGTAQVADLAGRAILGEQYVASMQVLVYQVALVHLGQSRC